MRVRSGTTRHNGYTAKRRYGFTGNAFQGLSSVPPAPFPPDPHRLLLRQPLVARDIGSRARAYPYIRSAPMFLAGNMSSYQSKRYTAPSRSFHDVEPQPGLGDELFQPLRLSRRVVAGGQGYVVPGRLLAENTLVLSEDAVVGCRNGRHYLMFRCGEG